MTNKREKEKCFNTQPPEGGWLLIVQTLLRYSVSTHSRLKAAGEFKTGTIIDHQFQHTAA